MSKSQPANESSQPAQEAGSFVPPGQLELVKPAELTPVLSKLDTELELKLANDESKTVLTARSIEQVRPDTPTGPSGAGNSQEQARYRPQKYCAVCGDKAIACNFNAVTCESCKAFFRRNAFKEQRLKCLFANRCIIDRVTRRFCSKCRLLKCFQIGMKREWILTDEQKQIKRVKIMQNKQFRMQADTCGSLERSSSSERVQQEDRLAGSQAHQQPDAGRIQRVEMRDVATSTSADEFELLGALPGVHYCTLQCQYCSLRLAGGSQPTMMMDSTTVAAMAYSQQQHQVAVAAAQARVLPGQGQAASLGAFEHQQQLADQHLRAQQHQAATCYYELELSVNPNHQLQSHQHPHEHPHQLPQHFTPATGLHQGTNQTAPGGQQISSVGMDSQQQQQIVMPLGPKC